MWRRAGVYHPAMPKPPSKRGGRRDDARGGKPSAHKPSAGDGRKAANPRKPGKSGQSARPPWMPEPIATPAPRGAARPPAKVPGTGGKAQAEPWRRNPL